MSLEFINYHTFDSKGINCVQIKVTKRVWEKRQASLMPTIFADGVACVALLLIFKAISDSKCERAQTKRENKLREK